MSKDSLNAGTWTYSVTSSINKKDTQPDSIMTVRKTTRTLASTGSHASPGDDYIAMSGSNELMFGGPGKDRIDASRSSGNNLIHGGQNDDIIIGGFNDRIFGDKGNDHLFLGNGGNVLTGDEGNDTFYVSAARTPTDLNVITDFELGQDILVIGSRDLTFADLSISSLGTDAVVGALGRDLVLLKGINPESLSPNNIIFDNGDVIIDWNATMLDAVVAEWRPPTYTARNFAMVHLAMYDAVNSVTEKHASYAVNLPAPPDTSIEAAAAAAAHRVLVNLYPNQQFRFDTQLVASLAEIPDGVAETNGIILGQQVADQILALRSNDNADATIDYIPGTAPGDWQPTPEAFADPITPHWPFVQPFAMTSGDQFRVAPFPALDSEQYAKELYMVKELGEVDSLMRTPDRTQVAQFWSFDTPGTLTPPGHLNKLAEDVLIGSGTSVEENARIFGLLNMALADAGIAVWDSKYTYNVWRPIAGIREADTDGNPSTHADPDWTPLLNTPAFPAYTSGHSGFAGATDAVLSALIGDQVRFNLAGDPNYDISRREFNNFAQAMDENGQSRLYGGVHWESDITEGLATGRNVGNYVIENFLV